MSETFVEAPALPSELRALNQIFGIVRYDLEGRIIGANPLFTRLVGYELDALIGQDTSMFISSTYERNQRAELWATVLAGEPQTDLVLWVARNGRELWLRSRYVPMITEEGAISEIVQIVSDATNEQLREADEQGQIAAINKSQAVIHFALDGTILDANQQFLDAMGYPLEEIAGQHHSMFVDDEYRRSAEYAAFWQALAVGEHKSGEYRRIHRNGSDVWLQAVYSPIFDHAGRPFKVVKYASDVTQEKLRHADYEWQISAIHKSNCVITFDMFGTIIDANDKFLEATGYGIDEVIGRHHKMFVDPAHAHGAQYTQFWKDLATGKHRSGLYKRYGKDGREIWLQATYNPIFDVNGNPVKVVKFASIVTTERQLQAEHQGQIAAIHNSQCVISFDLDGTVIDANENFLAATGYRFGEVRGRHHRMFVDDAYGLSTEYQQFWADLAGGKHKSGEYRRLAKNGREIWLQATYNPIFDLNGRPFKIVTYATDVTADKLAQAHYRGQIDAIHKSQAVVTFNLDGTILDANENFLDIVGYNLAELQGKHHALLVERDVAASEEYYEFWQALRAGQHHSGMHKRIGKDGREVWLQAAYSPILDPNGRPVQIIKYASDVSANVELAQAFDDAKRQAHHDAATSLPNRVKLSNFMDGALAGPGASLTVFYVDLDRFKPINDLFGHHVGDRVLGEIADRLRRTLRDDQMVARVGGDEFVIAAPAMPTEAIERFCKSLFDSVGMPIRHESGDITIGMSMGIAISPADGTTPDELLRAADAALYRSKESGRGQYHFYATEMNDRIMAQRKMTEDLRHGLAAGDFYLEYQPRFDTRVRRIRSLEALVRWAHPENGRVSPAEFIPLAEQNGLIVPLGDWILRTACQAATAWNGIGVSVNVSPVQFRDGNLVDKVREALETSGLPGHLLELEITEGVLLEDAERAIQVLAELKTLGIKLAMDDFGTGYSSLSYLRNFPFDVIKIDRSFIMDLDTRENARAIVQAILGLGKALGLSVTAEGVETNEQLAVLTMDQCTEVQGFLLGRPIKLDKVMELLAGLSDMGVIEEGDIVATKAEGEEEGIVLTLGDRVADKNDNGEADAEADADTEAEDENALKASAARGKLAAE